MGNKTRVGWGATVPLGPDTTAHARVYLEIEVEVTKDLSSQLEEHKVAIQTMLPEIEAIGDGYIDQLQSKYNTASTVMVTPQFVIPSPAPQPTLNPPPPNPFGHIPQIISGPSPVVDPIQAPQVQPTPSSVEEEPAKADVPSFDPAAFGNIGTGSGFFK